MVTTQPHGVVHESAANRARLCVWIASPRAKLCQRWSGHKLGVERVWVLKSTALVRVDERPENGS
jgi:hypothetical protein